MNDQSEHLSNAQVEGYGNRTLATGAEQLPAQNQAEELEQHLAVCASCRARVLNFQRTHLALLPDDTMKTAPTADCPSEDDLRNLAAGLTSEPLAATLLQHASTCDHCGSLLRTFSESFSDEFTAEEKQAIASQQASSASWQRETARKMLAHASAGPNADTPSSAESRGVKSQRVRFFSRRWALVPAAAAACAAIAVGIWYTQRDTPEKVEKLLAQAYTEKRTIEMRWPGAEWDRVNVTRGPSESAFSEPHELLDAKQIILRHSANANDLKWLRVKAETEILENHPEQAIELLGPAESTEQVPVLLDLAIAHSQLATGSNDSLEKGKVLDLLLKAKNKEPQNPTALFNLALAYEQLNDWGTAVQVWDEYLKAYPEGKWASEAREKREAAQKRKHFSLKYPASPPHDVASFLALSEDEASFQSEQYQDIALRYWLFAAIAKPEGPERQAVVRVGQLSERNSTDPWWSDFLSTTSSQDPSGAQALSAAFTENEKGHYDEAAIQSMHAARIFRQQGNSAGELRARYEFVYAERRRLTGKNCMARAGPLQVRIFRTRYYRLQSLLDTEIAVCLNYVGKLKESEAALLHGLQLAQDSHLPIAVLRNMAFSQSLHDLQREYEPAMREGIEGLRQYWDGPPCNERLYQFYAVFSRIAKKNGFLAASAAFMQRGVEILKAGDDNIQKAAALQELSNILLAEKENEAADRAARQANEFYDLDIKETTSRKYSLAGKIGLAEWQLQRDKPRDALATLEPVRGLLAETDGYFILLDLYRLSGNAHLALRQWNEASSAYQSAILIAEQDLSELASDEERLDWLKKSDDAYRGLVRVLLEHQATDDAWKLWEWYIGRSHPEKIIHASHRQAYQDWPGLWAEISSLEKPSQGPVRVIYAVFEDGVQVWSASHGQLTPHWIPVGRTDLEGKAKQFSHACARRDSPLAEIQTLGQVLFARLVQPLKKELPSARQLLAIETDRTLSDIPLEALRSQEGWYLGEKYSLVNSPGVLYEKQLRDPAKISTRTPFVLVDASAKGYFPGREQELSAIQHAFTRTTILGGEPDADRIKTRLSQNAIFGFIGHGETGPAGSGLRVSPKFLLEARDFPPQSLHRIQLATLAACSTGSSSADGLLDNRSLVHAFLAGGVPNVVASRWSVDSQSTAELMADFYNRLAHRQSVPDALFSARNHLLKTYSHPYYWAGFTLAGKTN